MSWQRMGLFVAYYKEDYFSLCLIDWRAENKRLKFVKWVLHFISQWESYPLLAWNNLIFFINFINDMSECLHVCDFSKPLIL